MKKVKMGNPRWLQEIINKKEYLDIKKRELFFNTIEKTIIPINFLNLNNCNIQMKIDNTLFEFNSVTKEIVVI